jgi:type IV secretion system protein VirB4
MNPFNSLSITKKEMSLSEVYPISHLNSPSIFESTVGHIGSTFKIKGVSFVTEENKTLNQFHQALHQAYMTLEPDFIVYITIHRRKTNMSLNGEFKSAFATRVNQAYFEKLEAKNAYSNDIYFSLVLKHPKTASNSLPRFKKYSFKETEDSFKHGRDKQIKRLVQKRDELSNQLSAFKPQLLGKQDKENGCSELIQFLSLFTNAGSAISHKHQKEPYFDGPLTPYLCQKQLLFGSNIQFQGASVDDTYFAGMLSIKQYPSHSASIILDPLHSIDSEFIATHSFEVAARDETLKSIDLKRSKLNAASDLAQTQISDLTHLEDEVASDKTSMGYYQHSLMLINDTEDALNKAINKAQKAYSLSGITVFKENLGLEASFFSQIPTNHLFLARKVLITARNFADFCALHNEPQGYKDENHLRSALTLVETPSKTPVYLNLHAKGSKDNPSKGHTLIIGGNGAGKTVLANFLVSQLMRYQGGSFYLERDEASRPFVLANDGTYTVITPSNADKVYFNPFRLKDTQENRGFIKQWFCSLLLKPDEPILDSETSEVVNDCVDYAFDDLDEKYRYLSMVAKCLPQDFPRKNELHRWLKGEGERNDGEYSWVFDNEEDSLSLKKSINGFDVSFLMDSVTHHISTPVYMYLLHRMRASLDAKLTSIVIDEAWQILGSPYWKKALSEWLPTIRKKNAHVIMMTQSPQTILESSIHAQIMDNKATLILFPNPSAQEGIYCNELKLNFAEFQAIANNHPNSRLFLYKQEDESILCKLDLSALKEELRVLSATEKSNRLLDSLIIEKGANPTDWLPDYIERSGVCS